MQVVPADEGLIFICDACPRALEIDRERGGLTVLHPGERHAVHHGQIGGVALADPGIGSDGS